jgi:hypothetical protein
MIKSRRIRWARHISHKGNVVNVSKTLVGKSAGKRQLGRPRHKWDDSIKKLCVGRQHRSMGLNVGVKYGGDFADPKATMVAIRPYRNPEKTEQALVKTKQA